MFSKDFTSYYLLISCISIFDKQEFVFFLTNELEIEFDSCHCRSWKL